MSSNIPICFSPLEIDILGNCNPLPQFFAVYERFFRANASSKPSFQKDNFCTFDLAVGKKSLKSQDHFGRGWQIDVILCGGAN